MNVLLCCELNISYHFSKVSNYPRILWQMVQKSGGEAVTNYNKEPFGGAYDSYFKGTVVWDGFLPFHALQEVDLDFFVWVEISPKWAQFYVIHRFFLRHIITFCAFSWALNFILLIFLWRLISLSVIRHEFFSEANHCKFAAFSKYPNWANRNVSTVLGLVIGQRYCSGSLNLSCK